MIKKIITLALALTLCSVPVFSAPLSVFDGWSMLADDDGVGDNGYVNPGWGGQDFDAEYLFYKIEGDRLHIGLQTGFDVLDGNLIHRNKDYYAGDLALSFDGDSSTYEYGFDFGLLTKGYSGNIVTGDTGGYGGTPGVDRSGLYAVSSWNTDIYFDAKSSPFAISSGKFMYANTQTSAALVGESFYRKVSFDLSEIDLPLVGLDVHWTMSCGNDAIDGSTAPVPEPATMVLLGSGLVGLALYRRKMKK